MRVKLQIAFAEAPLWRKRRRARRVSLGRGEGRPGLLLRSQIFQLFPLKLPVNRFTARGKDWSFQH